MSSPVRINIFIDSITKQNEIVKMLDRFTEYLESRGVDKYKIHFHVLSDSEKQEFLKDIPSLMTMNCGGITTKIMNVFRYTDTRRIRFAFIGKRFTVINPWGDSDTFVSIVSHVTESVIWHEVAHLIGANDHYEEHDVHRSKSTCQDPTNCLLTYGKNTLTLCETAINEIKNYLDKM